MPSGPKKEAAGKLGGGQLISMKGREMRHLEGASSVYNGNIAWCLQPSRQLRTPSQRFRLTKALLLFDSAE